MLDPIELSLFSSRVSAICDEMGVVLRRTAFSPNIKDRLDFSCALFNAKGQLCGQAAHIPVHLGSMAYAMGGIIEAIDWEEGDLVAVNDPYLGGTHLPDVTLVSPVYNNQKLIGFVANRAHHANIGCDSPGSMPVSSSLEEEGVIIPPTKILCHGEIQPGAKLLPDVDAALTGDFAAQAGANAVGVERLNALISAMGADAYLLATAQLNDYADRLMDSALSKLEPGIYSFEDCLDDDGRGTQKILLTVTITVRNAKAMLDFTGCDDQVPGNLNCPESVAAAAAFYCFRCLIDGDVPACEGLFRRIQLQTRPSSIVNATRPAAVAAGNVETSTRLVDVVFGALAKAMPNHVPAASQGTMNNVAMGQIDIEAGTRWDYYETLAGGLGGGPHHPGLSGVHSHMTNTLNTPVESLEMNYPLRLLRYERRENSGGSGEQRGGDGIVREYQFLQPTHLSLLTERRESSAWGLAGGLPGKPGVNLINNRSCPAKCMVEVEAGDCLVIKTPGGGGWGKPPILAKV